MLCKLANPLTKRTLLVIGQIQDMFSTSRNKCSSLVLKSCKSVQETSEEVLFIKSRQNHICQVLRIQDLNVLELQYVMLANHDKNLDSRAQSMFIVKLELSNCKKLLFTFCKARSIETRAEFFLQNFPTQPKPI